MISPLRQRFLNDKHYLVFSWRKGGNRRYMNFASFRHRESRFNCTQHDFAPFTVHKDNYTTQFQ